MSIDPALFRQVLGHFPTGVTVITATKADGTPVGFTIGSFTSVSLDPPLVGFLPDKKSSTWPQIEAAGKFCVNILGSNQQDLCRRLSAKGPERFADVDWSHSVHGLPILADTIATIECALHAVHEAGDHWFVLGKVLTMDVTRNEDPMLFHRGRYGGFAELA